MLTILITCLGLWCAANAIFALAMRRAPSGYQDKDGFHFEDDKS